MARRMRQRHERLLAAGARQPHIILHHRIAAAIAMFVAQPLEDPLGRVPLLHRCAPVRLQDRVDHRNKRPQLRLRHCLRAHIPRRQRKPAHLRDRLSAQPEDPRRLASAMTIQKYELANGGVNFHGKHPGQSPKGPALPLDGFYAARSTNTAPLQWQSFPPPRTNMTNWMPRLAVLAIATSLLAGCATARSDGGGCPPVPAYSREFLARAAGEVQQLSPGAAIEQMLADYQVMRDQARACDRRY